MECIKLLESLDILGYVGVCVGTERSQILQNSLLILQQENHFRKCYYWGRINGIKNDYYIAYGFQKDCMSGQVYYYSTDCINWLLLPRANKCSRFLTPLAVNIFEGDPYVVVDVSETNPAFPVDEDSVEHMDGPIPNELKEEDRLATTVERIKEEAVIIPRGGWFKNPNGVVVENCAFQGLTSMEVTKLQSYLHARPPRNKWNSNLLIRPDYNYSLDFLDTIDLDVPRGCWSLQPELGGRLIILHSLNWPGMTFYHRVNTPHYGFLYVGNGKKNMDLSFMI